MIIPYDYKLSTEPQLWVVFDMYLDPNANMEMVPSARGSTSYKSEAFRYFDIKKQTPGSVSSPAIQSVLLSYQFWYTEWKHPLIKESPHAASLLFGRCVVTIHENISLPTVSMEVAVHKYLETKENL